MSENVLDISDNILRDHIPPKQGLRQTPASKFIVIETLRDHIPPKQGLRLLDQASSDSIIAQRPYPTKTRIKTMLEFW